MHNERVNMWDFFSYRLSAGKIALKISHNDLIVAICMDHEHKMLVDTPSRIYRVFKHRTTLINVIALITRYPYGASPSLLCCDEWAPDVVTPRSNNHLNIMILEEIQQQHGDVQSRSAITR